MDGFNEQVVRRVNKVKHLIIKIISVILLITIPLSLIYIAQFTISYLAIVGFFVFIVGLYVVWYTFTSQKVDYEYSVAGNDLDVAKVISLRKRKKICKVSINEIEKLGKGPKICDGIRITKTFEACHDIDKEDDNYFAVFNSPAYGRCLLIFSPNKQILQGMKPHLNRDIVLKLFYNRNV